jgi:hypothetical protein
LESVVRLDGTKARVLMLRSGVDENILLSLAAYDPGANSVMAAPFCIPDIAVTRYAFPDTRVVVRVPLFVMPTPLNKRSKVAELANTFWGHPRKRESTGESAKIRSGLRI